MYTRMNSVLLGLIGCGLP